MKKQMISIMLVLSITSSLLAGCSGQSAAQGSSGQAETSSDTEAEKAEESAETTAAGEADAATADADAAGEADAAAADADAQAEPADAAAAATAAAFSVIMIMVMLMSLVMVVTVNACVYELASEICLYSCICIAFCSGAYLDACLCQSILGTLSHSSADEDINSVVLEKPCERLVTDSV